MKRTTLRASRGALLRAFVVVAVVFATPAVFGQEYPQEVSRLVSRVTVDGEPWVTPADEYDPSQRIIHGQNAEVDYPVELSRRQWERRLSGLEYHVLREAGTERAFSGDLYDNEEKGIYYSAATGQPLFSSEDKYESGTGWPSFTKPITPDAVAYKWDRGFFSRRIEVVDSLSGSHSGMSSPTVPSRRDSATA